LNAYETSIIQEEAPIFRIYPNPATHHLWIDADHLPPGQLEVSIHSLEGRELYRNSHPWSGSGIQLSLDLLKPGIYLLRCTNGPVSEIHRLMVINP